MLADFLKKGGDIEEYGVEDLEVVLNHYGKTVRVTAEKGHDGVAHEKTGEPMVNADACRRDWRSFVTMMSRGLDK
eukprot:gene36669-61212_t